MSFEEKVGLPLEDKLLLTKMRIQQWVDYWGIDHVVLSFSGGKDSTVLRDIFITMFPHGRSAFSDTGLEYPEIRNFVKTYGASIDWVAPERTFRDVIFNDGYPVVSKKVSEQIKRLRMGTTEKNAASHNLIRTGITRDGRSAPSRKLSNKWRYLEDAPFLISDKCCDVFKKDPLKKHYKKYDLHPMTAMMKSEGGQRAQAYGGECNLYDAKEPISNPMFFWTEDDVWQYIKENNIKICEIYYDREVDGATIEGERRTGCMFCMYGAHLEKGQNRFQKMAKSHPKIHKYCMTKLGMKEVLEHINVRTGCEGD